MELPIFLPVYFASKSVYLVTAFLCWKPEEILELWRNSRIHGVRLRIITDWQNSPELVPYDTNREGVAIDVSCPYIDQVINEASTNRAFNHRHSWLFLQDSPLNMSTIDAYLGYSVILPDADVTWTASDISVDVYRVKQDQPLIISELGINKNMTRVGLTAYWAQMPTTVTRRKNLTNVYLEAATIISQPQYFKRWSDLTNRAVDTFPKLTYPLLMLAAEDLNFRYNLQQVDLYGEERNGSFDGLAGMLQRGELEVGVTSMFMRGDRWRVLHYCSETVELRGAFLFRQPAQSAVSNVFVLPFSRGVWAAACAATGAGGLLLALLAALARATAAPDPALRKLALPDCFTFVIGAMCQQGDRAYTALAALLWPYDLGWYHQTSHQKPAENKDYITSDELLSIKTMTLEGSDLSPRLWSLRLVMFCMLLSSLFVFTSYSAKVVAILQSPSNALQTIDDLTNSPMTLGVQETTYKKVYFAESNDAATQRLYRRKLLPLGERAYLSAAEGVARLRTGLFAFQVEQGSGYDIISKTFTESEKCGLKEIQAFKMPMVAVPIRRHSGYRDLLASRLRWQREVGLMSRLRRIWLAAAPRCEAGGAGFGGVGLRDVLPAAHALLAGAATAFLLMLAECTVARLRFVFRRP